MSQVIGVHARHIERLTMRHAYTERIHNASMRLTEHFYARVFGCETPQYLKSGIRRTIVNGNHLVILQRLRGNAVQRSRQCLGSVIAW